MTARTRWIVAFAGALLAAVGLSLGSASAFATAGHQSSAPHERVRVMTLNTFYGGDDLDLATEGAPAAGRRAAVGSRVQGLHGVLIPAS
ncbi:hypothetical protein ACFRR7_00870 [Streptomyces sp. NPDC056909]|uniref:hypothetical protein n=1 Tax=Streptomyces sp. NPDC056909 TaxID=3345963 RepID=UPI00369078EA